MAEETEVKEFIAQMPAGTRLDIGSGIIIELKDATRFVFGGAISYDHAAEMAAVAGMKVDLSHFEDGVLVTYDYNGQRIVTEKKEAKEKVEKKEPVESVEPKEDGDKGKKEEKAEKSGKKAK